jgi:hypothetical protein
MTLRIIEKDELPDVDVSLINITSFPSENRIISGPAT